MEIVGETSLIADAAALGIAHSLMMAGLRLPAENVAAQSHETSLGQLAHVSVLRRLECGGDFTAHELYSMSPVAGESAHAPLARHNATTMSRSLGPRRIAARRDMPAARKRGAAPYRQSAGRASSVSSSYS